MPSASFVHSLMWGERFTSAVAVCSDPVCVGVDETVIALDTDPIGWGPSLGLPPLGVPVVAYRSVTDGTMVLATVGG